VKVSTVALAAGRPTPRVFSTAAFRLSGTSKNIACGDGGRLRLPHGRIVGRSTFRSNDEGPLAEAAGN
jgi:hypothetical protein